MSYFPAIASARTWAMYEFGGYSAVLLDRVRSGQTIQYYFVMLVFRSGDDAPCLAVASEWSDPVSRREPFLGVFPGDGHLNLGSSVDWLDRDKFAGKAMGVAADHLKVPPDTPIQVRERRKPWWQFWN